MEIFFINVCVCVLSIYAYVQTSILIKDAEIVVEREEGSYFVVGYLRLVQLHKLSFRNFHRNSYLLPTFTGTVICCLRLL